MVYVPQNWVDDSPPAINAAALLKIENGIVDAQYAAFSSPDNVVYVSKDGNDVTGDGSRGNPFLSIGVGNDYAITLVNPVTDWDELVVVKVSPGVYTEHIVNAHPRVVIVGINDFEHWTDGVILRNTGADELHYPIDTAGRLVMIGITVSVDSGKVFGRVPERLVCSLCAFYGGHFTERLDRRCNMYLQYCYMGCRFLNLSGNVNERRFFGLRNCDVQSGDPLVLGTTGTGAKILKAEHCKFDVDLQTRGDWSLNMLWTEGYSDGKMTFDTTGYIDIFNSIIVNGIHFVTDTSDYKRFVNNCFKDITPGQPDITSDAGVCVTDVEYTGNRQDHGLPPCIQMSGNERNVGGYAQNRYQSLQSAISSIPATETGIVTVYEDMTGLAELVLNAESDVTIKCGKNYDLAFTGDIVTLGLNQKLSFHEAACLSGEKMEVSGNGATLAFEGCLTVEGRIVCTAGVGSFVLAYFSSLLGITGYPAITVDNTDTLLVCGYSRVKGAAGQVAIRFNVTSVNKLKVKFSTLLHGDLYTVCPLLNSSGTQIDISMYNTGINATWSPTAFNNLVSKAGVIDDTAINF